MFTNITIYCIHKSSGWEHMKGLTLAPPLHILPPRPQHLTSSHPLWRRLIVLTPGCSSRLWRHLLRPLPVPASPLPHPPRPTTGPTPTTASCRLSRRGDDTKSTSDISGLASGGSWAPNRPPPLQGGITRRQHSPRAAPRGRASTPRPPAPPGAPVVSAAPSRFLLSDIAKAAGSMPSRGHRRVS